MRAFEDIPGAGVQGMIGGELVQVGSPAWVLAVVSSAPASLVRASREGARAGLTPVCVAVDGKLEAVLHLEDRLREGAHALIESLQEAGVRVVLLSGDHAQVAAACASTLGIMEAHGGMTPQDKLERVLALTRQGLRVVMCGDGVNDADAMQAASASIAMDGGTRASVVAADVFLTRGGLGQVKRLLRESRRVERMLERHMRWAILYNMVGVGLALGGLISPLLAAIVMPLSSAGLVLSTLAHRFFEPPQQAQQEEEVRASSQRLGATTGGAV